MMKSVEPKFKFEPVKKAMKNNVFHLNNKVCFAERRGLATFSTYTPTLLLNPQMHFVGWAQRGNKQAFQHCVIYCKKELLQQRNTWPNTHFLTFCLMLISVNTSVVHSPTLNLQQKKKKNNNFTAPSDKTIIAQLTDANIVSFRLLIWTYWLKLMPTGEAFFSYSSLLNW